MKARNIISAIFALAAIATSASPIRDDLAAKGIEYIGQEQVVPIAYLESTGTQFINTEVFGGDGLLCEIQVRRTSRKTNECFLGAVDAGNSHRLWLCYTFAYMWYPGYNGYAYGLISSDDSEWHYIQNVVENGRFGYLVDGTPAILNVKYTHNFVCSSPLLMFAMGTPSGANYFSVGQIALCRIWDSGVLVRDFQPVRIGNEGFMLDSVSGELFANQGTGSFTIGPDL